MITVSRRYKFTASHRLHSPRFSEEENRDVFGKCNNPFGHGHNYEIEVSVVGEIDTASGLVVDLARLDRIVGQTVIDRYDHRYLNEELPEFETEIPTTENLGRQIEDRLAQAWPSAFPSRQPALQRIRIFETARNIFQIEHLTP
jgi:6-pyruvoyltetrahydropterin/6-carboxytetrahydropterin synthase